MIDEPCSHRRTPFARRVVAVAVLSLVAVALPALATAPAVAAVENYKIDPAHSAVVFKIRHLVSRVPGRFTKFGGSISLDPSDLTSGQVQVSIETASIDTNEPARDKHLRSDAFFDAEKYPQITFRSTKVRQIAPNKLQIDGDLTIRGTSKPVTLDVDVLGFGPAYGGGYRGGFEARTKINRQDFGVKWNDVVEGGGFVLGDDVEITLNVEAVRETAKPAEGGKKAADKPAPSQGR